MFERVFISCKEGDDCIECIPFLNASSDPALNAWITKYNAMVAESNRQFVALNAEQAQPQAQPQAQEQEEIRHIGAGSYIGGKWIDDDIAPVANAEESFSGAGEYDPITKKWK